MSPGLAPDDMLRGLPPVHIIVSCLLSIYYMVHGPSVPHTLSCMSQVPNTANVCMYVVLKSIDVTSASENLVCKTLLESAQFYWLS